MMLDMDVEMIDKVSEPYEMCNHENKTTHKRYRNMLQGRYRNHRNPKSIFGSWREGMRLRSAVSCNDIDRVRDLLARGVNPNLADENGRTPLHLACCRGFSAIARLLLSFNADCNMVDRLGNTPLHLAVCTTSIPTVEMLLNAGSNAAKKGNNGCTPLQLAQSKLMLMQTHKHPEYVTLYKELSHVVEMMKKLVPESNEETELVNAFSSQLKVSQSDDAVQEMKELLDNISVSNENKNLKIRFV